MKIYENPFKTHDTMKKTFARRLRVGNVQEAYRISSDRSNVMRSSNPNTGIKKADISPTLDTVDPSQSKAQGGIAILKPYMLQGNMIGRSDNAGPQGKGYRQETAFTLNATDVHGVVQARVRKLTPVECERLMGFPDEYTKVPYRGKSADDCPDSHRYKACGNSMCVNVMRWIGMRIQDVENRYGGTDYVMDHD